MINVTQLNSKVDALVAEATRTEGTEDSAGVVIAGMADATKAAVTAALLADDAADQGSVDAATTAIDQVAARFSAADDKLGAAIAANNPNPPVPAPPAAPGA